MRENRLGGDSNPRLEILNDDQAVEEGSFILKEDIKDEKVEIPSSELELLQSC